VPGIFHVAKAARKETNHCIPSTGYVTNEWRFKTTPFMCLQGVDKENSFLETFAKGRKATISFVISVRLSAWRNSVPTGRIFMTFDVRVYVCMYVFEVRFFENLSRKFNFH
jgi:hypothetical protein